MHNIIQIILALFYLVFEERAHKKRSNSSLLNCFEFGFNIQAPSLLSHILRYTANLMISYFCFYPGSAIGSISRLKINQVFTNLTRGLMLTEF